MGGGKKKLSLSQMERAQDREEARTESKAKSGKRAGTTSGSEKRTSRISPPDLHDKGITKELQKMKVITPYLVASRLNLRISVAKDYLEELQRQGVITYVGSGKNIRIYKPTESA